MKEKKLLRHPLMLALSIALLYPNITLAQAENTESTPTSGNTPVPSNKPFARMLGRINVIGSRITRTEAEGPAPVTIITRADIDREGFQTVGDMLQSLSQQATSNYTGDLAVSSSTPNAQVINLRGMGPGYTLTLINGRRPPQYPQPYSRDNNVVNVRAIPSAIIERVEVLTSGASAIYGSDAVAGVVNIITRKNYNGNRIRTSIGTTQEGGGDSGAFELTGGKTGDRWSTLYALQYNAREPVFADAREFMADTRNNPYGRTVSPNLGLLVMSQGGMAAPRGHNAVYDEAACEALGFSTVTTSNRGTYCGSFTQPAARSISNKNESWAAHATGTFDISNSLQLFGSATIYDDNAISSAGTEFWSTAADRFTYNSSGAETGHYYDAALRDIVLLARIFTPEELGGSEAASTLYDERTYDLTFGLSGKMDSGFDWELSANYGKYDYELDRPRLLAKAVHDYFLSPRLGYLPSGFPIHELNLERWNSPITPEIYQSFATRVKNISDTSSATVNFTMSGDLFELPAGPVGFAGIIEGTRQTVNLRSDWRLDQLREIDEHTIYNLTGSGNTEGKRNRYAVGTEFRIPLLNSLTANLAGRYDKYDDITNVDDATTMNFGLEWRPFSTLLLRGSYATSFRAPDMQLVFAQGAASYRSTFDEYACRSGNYHGQTRGPRTVSECTERPNDVTTYAIQTRVAGNPLLKEEEGESWGYGFVWDIIDNMSMSVDYYRIRLKDRARSLSSGYIMQNEANCRLGVTRSGAPFEHAPDSPFCQNIYSLIARTDAPGTLLDGHIQSINTAFINSAYHEVSGIDTNFKYHLNTNRLGRFAFNASHSIRMSEKSKQFSEDTLIDYRDAPGNNPRSRVRGSIGWMYNNWGLTLFGNRLGSAHNRAEDGQRLKPYITYNMQIARNVTPDTRVEFTVVNLTNNQFRYDETNTSYPYFNPYIGADPLGRRFHMSVTHRF